MPRKIIWIVLSALLLLGSIALLWWWFLSREPAAPAGTGGFGSADTRPIATPPPAPSNTNQGVPIPPAGGALIGGTIDSSGGSSGGGGGSSGSPTSSQVPGVSWIGGGNIFNPTPINPVDTSSVSGSIGNFGGSGGIGSGPGGGSGLEGALVGAGIGLGLCTAGILSGATTGLLGSAALAPVAVTVNAPAQNVKDADSVQQRFLDCMTRAIARVALEQITASIVNWINSGFEGKPSFVTNYEQFFTNVADQAAGEFIRGSALSFLCSPFQPQVRIAIAQSYARRGAAAPSCSLTQVTNNIEGFLRGNFSQGGWPAFISLTTTPTNNPYGAYMYGQEALNQTVQRAVETGRLDITVGQGFLSQQKCEGPLDVRTGRRGPPCQILTPGNVIGQGITNPTLKNTYDSLNMAKNFDEIISALISQLITRTAYGGLSNLSANSGYQSNFLSSTGIQAQQEAQALLTALQSAVSTAQQYGYSKQGSITDIQNAQQQLQNLANCHITRNNSAGEQQALARIAELESRVTVLNNDIARANSAITALQQLQTRVFAVTTPAQTQAIQADFAVAQASGALITPANVTQAQQDRAALQAEMAALNQQTAAQTDQCYAGV
jgi:hypothetical protein